MQWKSGISRPCPAKTGTAKDTSRARTPASAASRAKAPIHAVPRAAVASKAAAKAGAETMSADAKTKASCELSAWLARYGPVEREIIEAHERRLANRARRAAERREADARAFGDLCEATEGFAVVWRRHERHRSRRAGGRGAARAEKRGRGRVRHRRGRRGRRRRHRIRRNCYD